MWRSPEALMVVASVLLAAGGAAQEEGVMPVKSGMAEVAEPLLYYEVAGEGTPLVLIHGGQCDRRTWDDQFQLFARRYRVIRYDVRGFGKSPPPVRPYSDVSDLKCLLEYLKVPKAHVIGLSLGGRIGIDFALSHPDKVLSLVAVGPGLSGYQWPEDDQKSVMEMTRAARDEGPEKIAELWLKDPYMAPAMENPSVARRLRVLATDNGPSWLANPFLERPIQPPAAKRLKDLRVPTLVVVGSRDVPDIQKIVAQINREVPGVKKVVIEGAGHMVNMEKPEEFNRAVLPFFSEQDGAPR
jgi:pimeloyl-ACP methyl ester carboxylesterase